MRKSVDKVKMIAVQNAEGEPETTAEILVQNKIDYVPKVSVIIPVYNVEKYLRACLDSVVGQTLREIEIICVDDGSTDSSLDILKEYAAKDERITVMRQENSHAGVARNAGLAVAKGEYIHFLDSDDRIEFITYEELYQLSPSADIVIFSGKRLNYKNGKTESMPWLISAKLNGICCTEKLTENLYKDFSPEVWNKLYSRKFVNSKQIRFQNSVSCNDVYFSYVSLGRSDKIYVTHKDYYYYRFNTGNQITTSRCKHPLDILYALQAVKNTLFSCCPNRNFMKSLTDAAINDFIYALKKSATTKYINSYADFFEEKDKADAVKRLFKSFEIPIVFATDDNYAQYVLVSIASVLESSNSALTYHFYIFHKGLNDKSIHLIKQNPIYAAYNCKIDFINIKEHADTTKLYSKGRFTVEMWYRILIPEILSQYSKVIYLDCDLIVRKDISLLYEENLEDKFLGVCRNFVVNSKNRLISLNINPDKYFNSGVLLFNVEQWLHHNLRQKCVELAPKHPNLDCPDQDILNMVCAENVKYLDYRWNFLWQYLFLENKLSYEDFNMWQECSRDFYIIHYTTAKKPWKYPTIKFALIWWQVACDTNFFTYAELAEKISLTKYLQKTCMSSGKEKKCIQKKIVSYKIFNTLPLFKFKQRGGNNVWKVFGAPVWRVRKMSNGSTVKYYLFGLPLMKIKDK